MVFKKCYTFIGYDSQVQFKKNPFIVKLLIETHANSWQPRGRVIFFQEAKFKVAALSGN